MRKVSKVPNYDNCVCKIVIDEHVYEVVSPYCKWQAERRGGEEERGRGRERICICVRERKRNTSFCIFEFPHLVSNVLWLFRLMHFCTFFPTGYWQCNNHPDTWVWEPARSDGGNPFPLGALAKHHGPATLDAGHYWWAFIINLFISCNLLHVYMNMDKYTYVYVKG